MKFTPSEFPIFNEGDKLPEWNEIVTSFGRAMNAGEISDSKTVTPRDALAAFE
jgi:hypothetical protein